MSTSPRFHAGRFSAPAVLALAAAVALSAFAAPAAEPLPRWIWAADSSASKVWFRKVFELPSAPKSARLVAACDNKFKAVLNRKEALAGEDWQAPAAAPAEKLLRAGKNILAVEAVNTDGPGGLALSLEIEGEDGARTVIHSGPDWRVSLEKPKGWDSLDHDDSTWALAADLGELGAPGLPWSANTGPAQFASAQPDRGDPKPRPAEGLRVAPGFKVDRIYSVPKALEGSWVAMAVDPKGRLILSDQGDTGLYRLTPPALDDPSAETKVERLPVKISGAHGLVWAFDSLYAVVNEKGAGLFRIYDFDGDGEIDTAEKLAPFQGGGEHGPHAALLEPGGKSLLVHGGNHTAPPSFTWSLLPHNWAEDLLLPRQWDANGHAKGVLAPGGWIARTGPDGKDWTMVSIGYRNQYDMAYNRHGDLFAYDSDMEWDMGMPWYVPTRVCHATSGSEFGWRSGSGRWPAHYEDSLPPVIDIGPGSPTGVVSGAGTKFPTRYQDALFINDWTFGTIWAIHLVPDGSSYKGTKEVFVAGAPLPVTDSAVGPDGALYFAVGGRGSQSGVYRAVYTGHESTAPPSGASPAEEEARALRRKLEAFHGRRDPAAVAAAWPCMGHPDRFIGYAARIAVEAQPVEEWAGRALAERDPLAAALGFIALARQGKPEMKDQALESIDKFDLTALKGRTLLAMLRAYQLLYIRLGEPDARQAARAIARIDPLLPGPSDEANAEAANLLVYLKAPSIIEKGLALMADARPEQLPDWAEVIKRNPGYGSPIRAMLDNPPPARRFHYAFALRNLRYGWTMPQREAYFTFINEAAKHPGGASYAGFLRNTRDEALANCSEAERAALAALTGKSLEAPPAFEVKPVKGPGRKWTLAEAAKAVEGNLSGRSFESGRNAFHAVGCVKCHRFDGAGGAVGPDLTTVRNKYSAKDLLESILEPSKVISDQYGAFNVTLKNGDVVSGLVVPAGEKKGDVEIYTSNADLPPVKAAKEDIVSIEPSKVSQMPEELADPLSEDELRDLVAYLLSAGDPGNPAFR